jgi:hypothetical protein
METPTFKRGKNCDQDCKVCYRLNLQVKWMMGMSATFMAVLTGLVGAIVVDRSNIHTLGQQNAVAAQQYIYVVQSINDIKEAMGLRIRIAPPEITPLNQSESK